MNNLLDGEVVTTVLVVASVLWDWKVRKFKAVVLQVFAALCAGTVVNSFVNLHHNPASAGKSLVLYIILTGLFYWWTWRSRHRKVVHQTPDKITSK